MFKTFYASIYDLMSRGSERRGDRRRAARAAGASEWRHRRDRCRHRCEPASLSTGGDPALPGRAGCKPCANDCTGTLTGERAWRSWTPRPRHCPGPMRRSTTAVVTFALCSVAEPDAALTEIARVLRPGGRLLFLEHVRDTDPELARKQDNPPFVYSWIGCHPNRDTLAAINQAPFEVKTVRRGEVPKAPRVERPMIVGAAERLI